MCSIAVLAILSLCHCTFQYFVLCGQVVQPLCHRNGSHSLLYRRPVKCVCVCVYMHVCICVHVGYLSQNGLCGNIALVYRMPNALGCFFFSICSYLF